MIFKQFIHGRTIVSTRFMERLGHSHALYSESCLRSYQSDFPLRWVAHQCGTCRFGTDPRTSVLDINCRTHEIDNLYVVDGSFFPSNIGSNPTLTIVANALRVGDHLGDRLK